jgi:hypothetical protein
VTGRNGSPVDVLIDAVGITAVALVALHLSRSQPHAGERSRNARTEAR